MKKTWQAINGIVLLDKGLGVSSNHALQQVRRVFQAAKAGHTGTLDPLATGLLPLCLGEASKFAQGLLDADKTYTARLCLGVTTATGDAEGSVLTRQAVQFTNAELNAAIASCTGTIAQIPPMYSALKYQGKPLYELARQGIHIDRPARVVQVYRLEILATSFTTCSDNDLVSCSAGEAWIDIAAHVSKGTYIRTLGQDIGAALGCGAHLSALRRTAVAAWTLADALTLEQFQAMDEARLAACLLPVDAMLVAYPIASLEASQAALFKNGGRIKLIAELNNIDINNIDIDIDNINNATDKLMRVYYEDIFLGIAALKFGVLHPIRLIGRGE